MDCREARRLGPGELGRKALKKKLGGLASWHTDMGVDEGLLVSRRLEKIMAETNRYHGTATRRQPQPVTLPTLRELVQAIRSNPVAYGGPRGAFGACGGVLLDVSVLPSPGRVTRWIRLPLRLVKAVAGAPRPRGRSLA